MKLSDWFREWNDVNVNNAKIVLVAILQTFAFGCLQLMWCVAMLVQLRHWTPPQDVDFHTEFLYLELGALLALSGINLASVGIRRTTDVDYQLAKNAGKTASLNVSGDNPSVNATIDASAPVQRPAALPKFTRPTRRQSAQMAALDVAAPDVTPATHVRGNAIAESADAVAGPRSIVTDHDRGII